MRIGRVTVRLSRANYKDDKRDGLFEMWYTNGQQCSRVTYKNDKLNGMFETWDSDGQLESSVNYKDEKVIVI